jgi:ADP-ribose pyrophosphatase
MKNNTVIENKLLSTKKIFQAKYFNISEIVVEKEGKEFTKDLITWDPVVFVIPFTDDGQVYLEMQWRDALERIDYEVVAGHVDASEDLLVAAKRELQEETGLRADKWEQIATMDVNVNMKAKAHIFVASDLTLGESAMEEDESIALIKMPLAEAVKKIESGEMTGGVHVASLLLFDKMRREGKI